MKKLKRFLAGVLTFAMAMSLMTMTAFADQTGGASGAGIVTETAETINWDEDGSLTLYKYEFKDGSAPTEPGGTGEAGQTIPSGATAIDGVGFTLYKIADLDDYYSGIADGNLTLPTEEISANDLKTCPKVEVDGETELFTGADGKVYWGDLDLGIYYVVESTPPQSATSTPVKFYVSIPMTTTDGKDWLYDVVVYPKNETSYAGVTLKKIGNETDTNTIAGAKFVLEKQDANDNTKWYYVKNEGTELDPKYTYTTTAKAEATVFTTSAAGTIGITGLSYGTYRFTETYAPNGYIMDETVTYEFYIHTDGKVYKDSHMTAEYLGAVITVNNEKPDVDKQIQKADGSWVGENTTDAANSTGQADYSIGDTVPFKIIVDVPSNVAKLKTFKVTDTMSAGLIDAKDFVIKGYTTDAMTDTGTDINVTPSVTELTWTADFLGVSGLNNYKKIVITFNATLDTDAVIAGEGNPNDVKLTYSNQVLTDNFAEPSKSELTDRVVAYAFRIKLTKTFDGAKADETYTAKFQLYRKIINGEAKDTTLTVDGGTVDVVKVGNEVEVTQTGTTPAEHIFTGLENGEYYLVETDTAPSYNLLKYPVKVDVNLVYVTTITTTSVTDENGNVTESTTSSTKYYTDDTKKAELTNTDETQEIVNKTGFTLPTTGGMGTYVFVFVGVSMMAAAVILFITTKKKETSKAVK